MKTPVDKREVFTDALETLGTKIGPGEKRDAIHLAVIPVEAGQNYLFSGHAVGIAADGKAYDKGPKLIGIVDPFLDGYLNKGEWFWLVIYPRKITSLRHVWTHPDIDVDTTNHAPEEVDKKRSEDWLRLFITRSDCPEYDVLIKAAVEESGKIGEDKSWENDGDLLTFWGLDAHGEIPPEFWDHIEVVTGKKIQPGMRANTFNCSC